MVSLNDTAVAVPPQRPRAIRQLDREHSTPLACELAALFAAIPDRELLDSLKTYYAGRRGYTHLVLWRTYVAMTYLSLPSFAALIRALQDNPSLQKACGIKNVEGIPSTFAYSRFMRKLANCWSLVKRVMRNLTRHLFETLPRFGKSVAIDSTDIKAHSNGGKKGKNGTVSDLDAGWCVKTNTEGRRKYVWGYKVHILCDTEYELPIAVDVTAGNVHDSKQALHLLGQTRWTYSKFHPDYVICDAGYSSEEIRHKIKRQYRAEPIINPNPTHKKAVAKTPRTREWNAIYNRRQAVERLNGRLKAHRRLNSLTVRGRFKVRVHAWLSIIVCQAQAVATGSRNSVRKVA